MTRLRENRRKMYPRVRPLPLRNYVNIGIQHSMLPIGRDDLGVASRRRPGKQFLGMTKECEAKGGQTTNAACRGRPSGAGDSNTEVDRVSRAGRWLKGTYFDHWTCDRGVVAARQVSRTRSRGWCRAPPSMYVVVSIWA